MKAKLPYLIPLAALILAGCAPTGKSTSSTSSEPPSSSAASESTSESASSSSSSSSSVPLEPDWTDEEKKLIADTIGNHTLPFLDVEALGHEYVLGSDLATDGSDVLFYGVNNAGFDLLEDFVDLYLEDPAYEDTTDLYSGVPAGMTILDAEFDDGTLLQLQFYIYDASQNIVASGTGTLEIDIFATAVVLPGFPEEKYLSRVEGTLGIELESIPEPEGTVSTYLWTGMDSSYNSYPMMTIEGATAASYCATLDEAGWMDNLSDMAGEGAYYYIAPGEEFGALIYDDVDGLVIQGMANAFAVSFPLDEIKALLAEYGTTLTSEIPVPDFPVDYYEPIDYWGSVYLYAYPTDGLDHSQDYVGQLLAAGYVATAYIDGEYYYKAPDGDVMICVSYDPDYKSVDIFIQPYSENYTISWDDVDASADEAIAAISAGEATAVLPEATFDWNFATFYPYDEDYGAYWNVDLQDIGENGTYVAHAADYKAIMDASDDWAYDDILDLYYDVATETVAVYFYDDEDYGFSIYIEAYVPPLDAFPVDDVVAGLGEMGITGTLPAYTGAGKFLIEAGSSSYAINIYDATQADIDAYVDALEAAGFVSGTVPDAGTLYWDEAKTMVVQVIYDEETATGQIFVQAYSTWQFSWDDIDANLFLIEFITGVSIPLPEFESDAVSYTTATDVAYFLTYIFDTSFVADWKADLVELGWTLDATPEAGYDESYSMSFGTDGSVTYQICISVDEAAGLVTIALVY